MSHATRDALLITELAFTELRLCGSNITFELFFPHEGSRAFHLRIIRNDEEFIRLLVGELPDSTLGSTVSLEISRDHANRTIQFCLKIGVREYSISYETSTSIRKYFE